MAKDAFIELQQQIEAIRREAFEAGYAAAMEAVRELASRSVQQPNGGAAASRRGHQTTTRASARTAAPGVGRSRRRRPQRGANARMIEEILQAAAPSALPPAAIRKALQEKGVALAFTSIRHALGQLEARKAARQVGNSRTWRYSATG